MLRFCQRGAGCGGPDWRSLRFEARIQFPTFRSHVMQPRAYALLLAVAVLPGTAAAQAAAAASSTSPVADAFRAQEQRYARILVAAAEAMPAEKYSYRPTPQQMSFA